MDTSFEDVYRNYHSVYSAALEYLSIQMKNGNVHFEATAFSEFVLFFRKMEMNSGWYLFNGYLKNKILK
ncbi:hypothetical protein MFLO_00490 [Listeria floridensis FSL S10-1187]|uniref:Uncharacterized protein n=2 Tax=Listeria floridensis TaxID=1494962 RepID=A0ABN0RIB5_9LIST|nr:hypothetical protein MFLO_00490 [Listeria floridensis FSL S10-1187]